MNRRSVRSLTTVLVLSGAMASFGAPALGDSVRTATALGGFSVSANAAPLKVLIDDPSNPLPRDPDVAIVEGDPSFTLAEVATGPASRGVASTLWPGNLLGEGVGAATNGGVAGYPVKAEARYPDKPFTADDPAGGHGMHATAMGLEAAATAVSGPLSVPGSVDVGSVTSTTTAAVDKTNVAIGHSTSRASDVTLLGLIKIGSVSTVVDTRSDGKKQTSTGSTVVSGLSIAGQGYVVDEKGAHPTSGPGSGPLPLGPLDAAKAAGITIGGVSQTASSGPDGAKRDAKGLRITVDTTLYRKAITDNTPGAVTAALYQAFAALPLPPQGQTYRSFLYYTLSATPKITFILGAGESSTVANLPLSYSFPSIASGTPPLFPPTTSPALTAPAAAYPSVGAPVVSAGEPVSRPGAPVVSAPVLSPASSRSVPHPFGGIGVLLLLGAGLGALLGGAGLMRLQGMVVAGGLAGDGCALGAPSTFPDLRGVTA